MLHGPQGDLQTLHSPYPHRSAVPGVPPGVLPSLSLTNKGSCMHLRGSLDVVGVSLL